jgi:hypothetical protein
MKRSEMAWIARDTMPMQWLLSTSYLCFYRHAFGITCSTNIISLDFLVTFLSKKKVTRDWGGNPKNISSN